MSHNSTNSSQLTVINRDLLKKCLELIAKRFGGKVSATFSDYYGKEVSSWMGEKIVGAIKTPSVPRGIGMIIRNGRLEFVGDNYGVVKAYIALIAEIESIYRKLGLILALSQEGYEVDIQEIAIGTLISGVKNE